MVEVASDSTDLIARVSEYVEETAQVDAIRAAYDFAAQCHDGQKRLSGDPYIVHPLAAATILARPLSRPGHHQGGFAARCVGGLRG